MAKGTATATASSAEMLAVDERRDRVTIQMHDESAAVYIGLNEDAVVGEGIGLYGIGDTVILDWEWARAQINSIGNTGKVSYQTGNVASVTRGP